MIVTNKDIENDIAENLMVRHDVIKSDVVREMMFYMREIYENKVSSYGTKIQVLEAALRAVNKEEEVEPETIEINSEDLLERIMEAFSYNPMEDDEDEEGYFDPEEWAADQAADLEEDEMFEEEYSKHYPENYIFCEGSNDKGQMCDGRDACVKYLGNQNSSMHDFITVCGNFTNLDLCKSLNYDFFEAK